MKRSAAIVAVVLVAVGASAGAGAQEPPFPIAAWSRTTAAVETNGSRRRARRRRVQQLVQRVPFARPAERAGHGVAAE